MALEERKEMTWIKLPRARDLTPEYVDKLARICGLDPDEIHRALSRKTTVLDIPNSFRESMSRFNRIPGWDEEKTVAFLWCLSSANDVSQVKALFRMLPPESVLRTFAVFKMAGLLNLGPSSSASSRKPTRRRIREYSSAVVTGNEDRPGRG